MRHTLYILVFLIYLPYWAIAQTECQNTPGVYDVQNTTLPCGQTGQATFLVSVGVPPPNVSYASGPKASDSFILPPDWSWVSSTYVDSYTQFGVTLDRYRITIVTTSPTSGGQFQVKNRSICINQSNQATFYFSATQTGNIVRSNPALSVTGPGIVCINGSQTYSLSGTIPPGSSINWSTNGSLITNGATNGSQVSVNATANSSTGSVLVSVQGQCGTQTFTRGGINTGSPAKPSVSITGVAPYGAVDVVANPAIDGTYEWYRDNSYIQTGYNSLQTLNGGSCGQTHSIRLTQSNTCGTSIMSDPVNYSFPCFSYRVSPNPSSDYVNLEFDDNLKPEYYPQQIELVSEKSTKALYSLDVKTAYKEGKIIDGKRIEINVSKYPRGTYYLRVIDNRNTEKPLESIRILLQ